MSDYHYYHINLTLTIYNITISTTNIYLIMIILNWTLIEQIEYYWILKFVINIIIKKKMTQD